MQKAGVFIYVLLVIVAIAIGGILINEYTDKGKDFFQSLQFSHTDDHITEPAVDTAIVYEDSTTSYDSTDSSYTIEADPAIIADTLMTGNPATDCLKELYGNDIMKKIDEGKFTPPADLQKKLQDCMQSKMNSSKTPAQKKKSKDESPEH